MPSYSGLWNNVYNTDYIPLLPNVELGNNYREIAEAFTPRLYGRGATGAILAALVGAAPGVAVNKNHKRVKSAVVMNAPTQGGLVNIETFTNVGRVTSANDVTMINRAFTYNSKPTYPVDLSGNGGGGKSIPVR